MSNKQYFGAEARGKLKNGIDKVFLAVSPTLGASGRNAVFNKWSRVPIVTNDGVSIAREVEPEDLAELQGANLIKQVSERTNDEAGDGTTTSIILAHEIVDKGMDLLNVDVSVNPMKLRREINEASDKVIAMLKSSAQQVDTLEKLEQIATISVESPEIGKTIAKAIHDAGENGIVYVNESVDVGVSIEKVEGYQFQQGLVSPYLIKDVNRMETVIEDAAVLVTEMPLQYTNEFGALIKTAVTNGCTKFLIVCDEIHPDVIKFAAMNMAKQNFDILIVKKPMQKEYLEDISAVVGATAMTKDKGMVHPKVAYLGRCAKVVANEKSTTIFPAENESLTNHVEVLKAQLEIAEDEIEKTKLQERIARLTGGVYLLNVGEKTEAESKYLKLKVDDAVNATRAAKEEGFVAGGGVALFHIGMNLMREAVTHGAKIVSMACIAPFCQLLKNSGETESSTLMENHTGNSGYNALTNEYVEDVIAEGIIDPVKVTISAFTNASSFAALILTTETLITPIAEAKDLSPR